MLFKQRKPKQILALGGGAFSMEPENGILDKYMLNLALVKRPRICFLGTASDDGLEYREKFYDYYKNLECEPFHLSFVEPPPDMEDFIMGMDILHVGGGSTRKIIDTWKKFGADKIIKKAYEQGVIMTGMSAGAICWFDDGIYHDKDDTLKRLPCLGLLKGSFCPHFDDEGTNLRKTFHDLIAKGTIKSGYGVDDGAALHFVDGELIRVVTSRIGVNAFHIEKCGRKINEVKIPGMYLGDEKLAIKEKASVEKTLQTLSIISMFIDLINAHDLDGILTSVTKDLSFYDSMGVNITGIDKLKDAWGGLFSLFPDYKIEAKEILVEDGEVVIFGEISGTFSVGDKDMDGKKWNVRSAWRVLTENGKINQWRVYTDMEPIREMRRLQKNGAPEAPPEKKEEIPVRIQGEKINK